MTTFDYIDFSLATVSVPFMLLFLGVERSRLQCC